MAKTRSGNSASTSRTKTDPFWSLVATARRLNAPGGCPWDQAQTVRSLVPHLIEEVWEVFCAHRRKDRGHLQEELGDVLYTVVFLVIVGEREGVLNLNQLLGHTRQKITRRHPHVFGDEQAKTTRQAYDSWQRAKKREATRPSDSKRMRPLILSLWEQLESDRGASSRLKRMLGSRTRGASARPRKSNGPIGRSRARSSGPGPHPTSGDQR